MDLQSDLLSTLRKEVDKTDLEILNLFKRRFEIVQKIANFKKENDLDPLDEKRWNELLKDRKLKAMELGIDIDFVQEVFESIHKQALKIESLT